MFAGIPLVMPGEHFTTSLNLKEVKDRESRRVVEMALESGRLKVRDPSPKSVKIVSKIAEKIGEIDLSNTDISVLALAYELNAILLTDDYAVQNVASHLGLRWERVRDKGIGKIRKYVVYCPICKREYTGQGIHVCPYCGVKLRKKIAEEGERV